MRQILCVIDLSDSSGKVLEVAARFASAWKASLLVLFPYRLITDNYQGNLGSLKLQLETEAREKFNTLRGKLPACSNGLACDFQPEIGFVADRIRAHVSRDKDSIDMVILGQEQSALLNDSKGLNLQSLIANLNIPFVIVPAERKEAATVK